MTLDAASPTSLPPPTAVTAGDVAHAVPSRSFARRVLDDTFARIGARVGIAWIGLVAFFAVFAPFIANSHPYFLRRGDSVEFPLFRHLSHGDIVGLCVFAAVVVCAVLRSRVRTQTLLGILAAVAVVGGIITIVHVTPEVTTYSAYREDQALGDITHVVRAPIPYSFSDRLRDVEARLEGQPPSAGHWFGTTPNREDVLSGMIHACRIAVLIGFISTGIAVVIGCIIGGLMGYFSGWVDIIGMRLIEIFEAIPTLFLLITFVAFYGRNLYVMMAIIGATSWTGDARFIRAQFLQLRKQDYVYAATALGLPLRAILFRHMLPNGIGPVLVSASFGVAQAILAEATLSFLGLGLIDQASWGTMLNQARGVGTEFHWWLAAFPGGAIFLTVFAYNLIGEAFRDALDPKLKKRE